MTLIMGIDPGSRITGYGIIREQEGKLIYVDSGCIRAKEAVFSERLMTIFSGICHLMETYSPQEVAIEQVFIDKNVSAALKLGHARGVAMVACSSHRVPVNEYSARAVKQAVTGYGGAQKFQVTHMVVNLLQLNRAPQSDAADALAIAVCHSHMRRGLMALTRAGSARRRR